MSDTRPTSVVINSAIDLRGISGTARSVALIRDSLGRIDEVDALSVWPPRPPNRGRARNAVDQIMWDFWAAGGSRRDADVLVSPCNFGVARRGQRHVLVVHDTMALDAPELFDSGYQRFFKTLVGLSIRRSDVVLVPSEYTASRIKARWPHSCTVVAPWPLRDRASVRRGAPGPRRTILMVGVTEPYKNHIVGIDAVARLRGMTGDECELVLVGPAGRAEDAVRAAMSRVDPACRWTDRRVSVTDAELDALYGDAWVLLQPSILEGFGLPVAEAAALGLPVVHSGRGALPEIVDAGVSDSSDPETYADHLRSLLDPVAYAARVAQSAEVRSRLSPRSFDAVIRRALELATGRPLLS